MRAILDICNLIFLCRVLNKGVSIFPQWLAGVSCIFHHQAILRVGCWYPDFFCLKVSILLPSGIARFNTFFTDYVTTGKHKGMYTLDSMVFLRKFMLLGLKAWRLLFLFGLCAMLTCLLIIIAIGESHLSLNRDLTVDAAMPTSVALLISHLYRFKNLVSVHAYSA